MKLDREKIEKLKEERREAFEGIFNAYEELIEFLIEENESLKEDKKKEKPKKEEKFVNNIRMFR